MSLPPRLASNPLQDDDLSDVTKREIIFWANKLKVSPSQLFSLTKEELDALLEIVIYGEQQRDKQAENYERLKRMKQKLIDGNEKDRLKGGLEMLGLLCNAARDIETYLCQQAYVRNEVFDNDDTDFQESSGEEAGALVDPRYRAICPRADDANATYDVLNNCVMETQQNTTYNVPQQECPNNTFNIPCPIPADASAFRPIIESTPYDIRSPHEGADRRCPNVSNVHGPYSLTPLKGASAEPSSHTFTCLDSGSSGRSGATRSRGAQASPSRCPQAGQTRTIVQNSYGNKAQNMQVCSAPPPNSPGAWAPQQVHFIGDPDSSKTFRNYTDYAVTYGPLNSPSAEPSSHAFTCLDSGSSGRSGTTRSRSAQASPSRCPQAGQTRTIVQNSYDNKAQNMQVCSAPPPNSPGAWAPQQIHFIGDPDSSKTFSNYTDYAVTLNSPSAEPSSHAFTCLDSGSSGRSGTTRSRSAQASPSRCPQAGQTRTIVQNSYGNKAQNMQVCSAPPPNSPGAWAPQQIHFIGDPDSSETIRNYTDYAVTYGPLNSPSAEPSSHAFTCLDSGSSGRSGTTRSRSAQASPSRCPQAGQTRTIVRNSYGNQAQNMQVCSAPPPNSPGAWAPQQIHFIGDPDSSETIRNYTNYAITYGPGGSEETANSITVESFDGVSGKVTASSRTFSLPPACSPTDALGMSRISPPVLASGTRRLPIAGP